MILFPAKVLSLYIFIILLFYLMSLLVRLQQKKMPIHPGNNFPWSNTTVPLYQIQIILLMLFFKNAILYFIKLNNAMLFSAFFQTLFLQHNDIVTFSQVQLMGTHF